MTNEELQAMAQKAKAWFDGLSPVQQAIHLEDQRRSYIRGLFPDAKPGPHWLRLLHEELIQCRNALIAIAAYHDTGAEALLYQSGSYAGFDEPHAVKLARKTLEIPSCLSESHSMSPAKSSTPTTKDSKPGDP